MPPDLELGGGPVDDHRDHSMTTSNQPFQGESNFWDSSGPLFSIYYNAAKDEDSKMVEGWQKDAEGIIIFTGLFSAAVAALLAVTIQDLRPNSQDTSAFYLGNIYQVLADPNLTRSSIPSPVVKPPSFTPPRYAVWVNSLWFLSLVMGLSCALWATSLQQWARRYLRMSQPARCSPEKRARMRAFFANGVGKMHVPLAVEGLPTLLHVSLFLFFGGLAIFLFNIDREVFSYVIWWIGLFWIVYGFITLLPIIRHDSPYNSPLSAPAWLLYASIRHVTFRILAFTTSGSFGSSQTWGRLRDRYQGSMLGGVEKAAEDTASRRLSEIDVQILDWTISSLGDDDSLKSFFEAIPGFFNSKLVNHLKRYLPEELLQNFKDALHGFLGRTWSSSVDDSEKLRRLDIAMNAMNRIRHSGVSSILSNIRFKHWNEVPQTVEMGQTLARWCTSSDQSVARDAQLIITRILVSVRERNDSWVTLAARVYGLPERDLWDKIALGGDSVLLTILIQAIHPVVHSGGVNLGVLRSLSRLDIHNTLPRLQHDFCVLWNKIVQEARKQGPHATPVIILHDIRHLYIALHQNTDAAHTAFSASTNEYDDILFKPSSYPFCSNHLRDSVSLSTPPGNSPVTELPWSSNPTTTGETGDISQGPNMTRLIIPAHSSPRPTGESPTAVVAAAPQDIISTATLSHPLEGSEQQDTDVVVPSAEPGISQILTSSSTRASIPTLAPIPTSLPNICSSITASRPTSSTTPPRLRARGLVNTRNSCFGNAVLQLLINSPPFWKLYRELVDLKRQRGAEVPEAGGGATPLVDATVRFFKEFIVDEESPSTQRQSQPATGGISRADEDIIDSFEPTYLYDALKEKRQLKPLLDGQQQDAGEFLCLYLDALDEELLALPYSMSNHQSAHAALEVEEREVSQSGQTEVGSQGFMANFVESPTARIFGGKFRSPIHTSSQPDLVPTEDWRSLHLDIQPELVLTVQDALMRVSQSQVGASGLCNASQQALIEALPAVLVLHLNRVRYDPAAGAIVKIRKSIEFAPELEIPLDIMVPDAQRRSEPRHYKLHGVLYHHGESADGGHYTVDIVRANGDGDTGEVWLHIDDEAVSPLRHEDVFGEQSTERPVDRRCAYLLFYCRTSPIVSS